MKSIFKYTLLAGVWWALLSYMFGTSSARVSPVKERDSEELPIDPPDTNKPAAPVKLKYPFKDQSNNDPLNFPNSGGVKLKTPSNVKTDVEYDPETNQYNIKQKMGDVDYRPPTYMDQETYTDYQFRKTVKDYWKQRIGASTAATRTNRNLIPPIKINNVIFDRIFGGSTVDIRPQGSAELIFAYNNNKTENPALPVKQRSISTFDFNEKIQLNVIGKIGDKMKLTTNYNTEATFDFENQMKLQYTGYEDEIIKTIEAGNVSLPLTGSLITGSQSLFGIKTALQFGALTATTIFSQQKGQKKELEVNKGAQTTKFELPGDQYDANKHYFLSMYFHDNYDHALSKLPVIISDVNITKIEVWVTNKNSSFNDTRNIVAFADLGEGDLKFMAGTPGVTTLTTDRLPDRNANNLYNTLKTTFPSVRTLGTISNTLPGMNYQLVKHYEKLENARKLAPTEYTLNAKLGFISLNSALNYDEVLGVAYQYTYNGKVYQVGEFSTDGLSGQEPLFLKMLKSTNVSTAVPLWKLMMKNVYNIGAYQVKPDGFKLDVWYANQATGVDINYIPEGLVKGHPLINVLNVDKLTSQGIRVEEGDGVFDFLDGLLIQSSNGRVFFPSVEPFGSFLRNKFDPNTEQQIANKYVFQELYDSTKTSAQQFPSKNRFKLKGSFQSSSGSEISLGAANVPQGSVTVTAGGIKLTENVDYTVDYTLGRVKIINEGLLNSNTPIKISLESNSLFSIQSKTLIGTHLDYRFSKDFNLGATFLNLTERPLTRKINIGDEPISNTIWGLDGSYRTEAPFLTRLIDKLPFFSTKEMSTISGNGEFAQLIPGHASAIGSNGNSYIDDFEGSQSRIDLKSFGAWSLASTPQGQPSLFKEASLSDDLAYGFNRAKLAWYTMDPLFLKNTSGLTPANVTNASMSNDFTREVLETELFPNKQSPTGQPVPLPTLDLAYYPSLKGPYNYDVEGQAGISSGINPDGTLKNPATRWGGIMRRIETNDFEAANIEYIQFWMMDPYNSYNAQADQNTTGDLYFNLGNISEDVLKDSKKSFENGLPTSPTSTIPYDVTHWGRVPSVQSVVNTFDNDPAARIYQDVGLDGLRDADERTFFADYLQHIATYAGAGSKAYADANTDPSSDDYHYYRGTDYDNNSVPVLERYKMYNGPDGNSPTSGQPNYLGISESYPTSATTSPTSEDINRDNTLSESEDYYQYHIRVTPGSINDQMVGKNYITDMVIGKGTKPDGTAINVKWFQFKIPVKEFEARVGSIQDFKSIRFMRMFFKGVDKPVICRFARLELIRSEWRKYNFSLLSPNEYLPNDDSKTTFEESAVNYEENGTKQPVNYVLPPGINREVNVQTATLVKLNEQALALKACNLEDGDSRAVYRNTDFDVRTFKKLRMYVHGEALNPAEALHDGDLTVFIRLGTDYTSNYYEYELPLHVTPPGVYNGADEDKQKAVWPDANLMVVNFESLQLVKQLRNNAHASINSTYTAPDPEAGANNITVLGNPNLASVKTIMIGIRNPKNDGLSKCAEVWVNELRLTDFNEQGGWAATAMVKAKLADIGDVSLSGSMSTPGFGGLESKMVTRQKETKQAYDFSSTLLLHKFLPESWNLSLPMYVGYSEAVITPQYNPLDPDILLKPFLSNPGIKQETRDSLAYITVDYTRRRSINFSNVKKNRGKGQAKQHIYDIENFAANYSYTEINNRNVNIEYNNQRNYRGGLTYNYAAQPKNIKPFDKMKVFNSKYFALIKDFNFYLYPNKYAFTTDVNRQFAEMKTRNTTNSDVLIIPTYNKNFNWNRTYSLNYDLTKNLKMDFNATNEARILEPFGRIDTQEKRDTIKQNIANFGQTNHYHHTINVNYTIPINKILPVLDFTSLSAKYSASYDWMKAPLAADSLGNTIQNAYQGQLNGQFNMTQLYNKVPFFKKINQEIADKNNKPKIPVVKPKVSANDTSKNKKPLIAAKDTTNQYEIFKYIARGLMSIKNISFTASQNEGTILSGYRQKTQIIGFDEHFGGPTPGFLFGDQKDIRPEAIQKDWLWKNPMLNTPYSHTFTQNLNGRATIEPFTDFKIELTTTRQESKNKTELFRWSRDDDQFHQLNQSENGNFSISVISIRTAFVSDNSDHVSQVFEDFLGKRSVISTRLGYLNPNSGSPINGFSPGYGPTSQEVLIPAFLAAYTGQSENTIGITNDAKPIIPLPNWRITYDGLSKLDLVKKYFKTVTVSHAYRSTYSIGSYASNLGFVGDINGNSMTVDEIGNFVSRNVISGVSISEQFSPLIKLDMTLIKLPIIINLEVKKDRNLSLALTNYQLTEVMGREIIIGSGYRWKDLTLPWKIGGKPLKSDLVFKVDLSFRYNATVIRKVVEDVNQATAGQDVIILKTSADYVLTERLNIKLFFDKTITTPQISSSFPTSNTSAGMSIRFTLAQ